MTKKGSKAKESKKLEQPKAKTVVNFYNLFRDERSADKNGKRSWFEKNRKEIKTEHLAGFMRRDLLVLASVVGFNPYQKTKQQVLTGTARALNKKGKEG